MHYMYGTVSIPKDLVDEVELILNETHLGYRTKTEFIVEAIREKVLKIKLELNTERLKK